MDPRNGHGRSDNRRMVRIFSFGAALALAFMLGYYYLDEERETFKYQHGVVEKKVDISDLDFQEHNASASRNKTVARDTVLQFHQNKTKTTNGETASAERQKISNDTESAGGTDHDDEGTPPAGEDDAWNKLSPTQQTQVENYRRETGLILNVHPTHHAGTSFCSRIGRNGIHGGIAPKFACMGDTTGIMPDPPDCLSSQNTSIDPEFCYSFGEMTHRRIPWTKEETGPFVEAIRPYFHMISWEFGSAKKVRKYGRSMDDPDWGNPKLVSVVVTRDPLSRLLSGDGTAKRKYPGFNKGKLSRKGWWDYAVYDDALGTNNFFLRILIGKTPIARSQEQKSIANHVKAGVNRTTEEITELFPTGIGKKDFEHGKELLDKFTFVLDIACLNEGMDALGKILHLNLPSQKGGTKKKKKKRYPIGYEDVYEYLVAKNKWDIALYEYSKNISLVKCDEL